MTDQATTETSKETVNLNLGDLVIAAQAIQVAAQRGAFRAEEFSQIGGAFERIAAFLESSGAITRKEESTPAEDQADAESEGSEA